MCQLTTLFESKEFWSAIAGGFVAGGFSLWTIRMMTASERKKIQLLAINESLSFLRAIRSEMTFILDRYCRSVGDQILNWHTNQPFTVIHRGEERYFTIFDNNGVEVGKLKDEKLQGKIVEAYVAAKGMMDVLRANNHLLEMLDQIFRQPLPVDLGAQRQRDIRIDELRKNLAANVSNLKQEDIGLRKSFTEALELIAKHDSVLLDEKASASRR